MSLDQDIRRGILWNHLGSIVSFAVGILLSILVVRKLGPVDYGHYVIATTVAGTLVAWTALGFEGVIGRHVAAAYQAGDVGLVSTLLRTLLLIRGILLVTGGGILYLFRDTLTAWYGQPGLAGLVGFAVLLAVGQGLGDILGHWMLARLRLKALRMLQLGLALLFLTGAISLQMVGMLRTDTLLMLQAGFAVLQACWLLAMAVEVLRGPGAATPPYREIARFAALLHGQTLLTFFLAMGIEVLLLGYFHPGSAEIAFYTIAIGSVGRIGSLVTSGIAGMVMPTLSRCLESGGLPRALRMWDLFLKLQALLVVPAFAYCLIFAPLILRVMYTSQYDGAIVPFQIVLLFNIPIYALGCGMHSVSLQVTGHPGSTIAVRVFTATLNLVGDLVLIPPYGVYGAVLATTTATLLTVLLEWLVFWHRTGARLPVMFVTRISVISALAAALMLPMRDAGVPGAGAGALLFVLALAAGLRLWRPFSAEDHRYFLTEEGSTWSALCWISRPVDGATEVSR